MTDEAAALARRWRTACRSIEGPYRGAYLRAEIEGRPVESVAPALDLVCFGAEQAEQGAQDLLIALIEVLAQPDLARLVQLLKRQAIEGSLLSLGRLLRRPDADKPSDPSSDDARIPDYGFGRPLTLGERKALARRPTRKAMDKLFADPHPLVIRMVLGNPKVVEDDVVRLAARRPGRPEILTEIVRSARWLRRRRVRMAVLLNPDSPLGLAVPLLALLLRAELEEITMAPYLDPVLRAAAWDRLERRPPVSGGRYSPPSSTSH